MTQESRLRKTTEIIIPEVVNDTSVSEQTVQVVFRAQKMMHQRFCNGILLFVLATIALRFGAVQVWIWSAKKTFL